MERFHIKWKLRAFAGPMRVSDAMIAKHLVVSPQSFSYRMKNGFSKSEVMAICSYLSTFAGTEVRFDEFN